MFKRAKMSFSLCSGTARQRLRYVAVRHSLTPLIYIKAPNRLRNQLPQATPARAAFDRADPTITDAHPLNTAQYPPRTTQGFVKAPYASFYMHVSPIRKSNTTVHNPLHPTHYSGIARSCVSHAARTGEISVSLGLWRICSWCALMCVL